MFQPRSIVKIEGAGAALNHNTLKRREVGVGNSKHAERAFAIETWK